MNIRQGSSPFHRCRTAQWQTPPWGAESGLELGPALQRADVLPTEPRRTHSDPRRTQLSYVAPIDLENVHSKMILIWKIQFFAYLANLFVLIQENQSQDKKKKNYFQCCKCLQKI